MEIFRKTLSYIDKILLGACVLGMLILIVSISAGVVARRFFTPFPWTEELATFIFINVSFYGAACSAFRRREIVVDFFIHKFPEKIMLILNIITKLLIMALMAVVFIGGIQLLPRIPGASIALDIPRYLYYVPVAVAAFAIFFYHLADLIDLILAAKNGKPEGLGTSNHENLDTQSAAGTSSKEES